MPRPHPADLARGWASTGRDSLAVRRARMMKDRRDQVDAAIETMDPDVAYELRTTAAAAALEGLAMVLRLEEDETPVNPPTRAMLAEIEPTRPDGVVETPG